VEAQVDRMLSGLKFSFHFDPVSLQRDLAAVRPEDWAPHYNESDYGGQWRGAALRSATGLSADLTAGQLTAAQFRETPLLARCPYFREALAALECPLKAARLLSLAPGSFIREHSDHALDFEDGEIRIHIPVETNPAVEFYVGGERLLLEEGGCYYVNVNLPHRVNNRGERDRVHLVIDAEVNDWVRALFRRGGAEGWHIPRCPLPAHGFDDFRAHALATPVIGEQLRAIPERSQLAPAALNLGRGLGFDFTLGDAENGARHPLQWSGDLRGWTPAKVFFRDSRPFAEWIFTGDLRLTEPFFADSLTAALHNPFAAFFRREAPLEDAAGIDALPLAGFLFHVSRCGSTLATQMFAALDRTVVVAEAPAIDHVIQARLDRPDLSTADHAQWLRWIVAALGQRRSGRETHYIVKLDSWHIHDLPLFRAAFPETPWIFLEREAAEVEASQERSPGMHGAPGAMDPRILRMKFEEITSLSRQQWRQRVIEGYLQAAEPFRRNPAGLFLNYRDLPGAIWERAASHFGLQLSADERELMCVAAQFDSKNPGIPYQRPNSE
jgi:Aspartyl/Asparaginyl beta-hydroxylase